MLFFNGVVVVELGTEREAREDQLCCMVVAAGWMPFGHVTGILEMIPGQTEMVMLGGKRIRTCLFLGFRGVSGRLTNWSICTAIRLKT